MSEMYSFNGEFKIDLDIWEKFKSIEPKYIDGYYHPNVITWDIGEIDTNKVLFMLHMISNSITRENLPKLDYQVYDYQISLLQRTYYDGSESEPIISIGYKRPFGTFYVEGDITEEIIKDSKYLEIHPESVVISNEDEDYPDDTEYELTDISGQMDGIYKLLLDIIKHYDWEFLNYYGVNTGFGGRNVDNPTFSESQKSNMLTTPYVHFYPNLAEYREIELDKLIK